MKRDMMPKASQWPQSWPRVNNGALVSFCRRQGLSGSGLSFPGAQVLGLFCGQVPTPYSPEWCLASWGSHCLGMEEMETCS